MEKSNVSNIKTPVNAVPVSSVESFLNIKFEELVYNELAEIPLQKTDILEALQKNMQTLSDLRSRMQFMNKELRYLLRV